MIKLWAITKWMISVTYFWNKSHQVMLFYNYFIHIANFIQIKNNEWAWPKKRLVSEKLKSKPWYKL